MFVLLVNCKTSSTHHCFPGLMNTCIYITAECTYLVHAQALRTNEKPFKKVNYIIKYRTLFYFFFQCSLLCNPFILQGLQRVQWSFHSLNICMHLSDTDCCTSIFVSRFVFSGELMWIFLGTKGSIQQQTGGDPSQSFCLTGRFAPTVSFIYTHALEYKILYSSIPIL